MTNFELYTISNSPYSDKVRAGMRLKGVPFAEHKENIKTRFEVLKARTGKTMVPVLIDRAADTAINDSTRILDHLDAAVSERRLRPEELRAQALDRLLEDFADEWLVRPMLHSRWRHEDDARQNAIMIATEMTAGVYGADFQQVRRDFPPAITSSLPLMGATEHSADFLQDCMNQAIGVLGYTVGYSFLLGARPSICDLAFYGQLNQYRRDPAGAGVLGQEVFAPTVAYMSRLEAAAESGAELEPEVEQNGQRFDQLLEHMARTYVRNLVANANALEREGKGGEFTAQLGTERFAFTAARSGYGRKMLDASLVVLDELYASGVTLFADGLSYGERSVLEELSELDDAIIAPHTALKAQLASV